MKNTTERMTFSIGDLMVRQVYMKEAGAMVWEILEFRACSGKYAEDGDHAWLSHDITRLEPFKSREDALAALARAEEAV